MVMDTEIHPFQLGATGDVPTIKNAIKELNNNTNRPYVDSTMHNIIRGASKKGNLPVVKYLFDENITDKVYLAFESACRGNHIDILEYLMNTQRTSITLDILNIGIPIAVSSEYWGLVKYLLEHGSTLIYYLHGSEIRKLMNDGLDYRNFMQEKQIKVILNKRDKYNTQIKEVLLNCTAACSDVIDLVCSYMPY